MLSGYSHCIYLKLFKIIFRHNPKIYYPKFSLKNKQRELFSFLETHPTDKRRQIVNCVIDLGLILLDRTVKSFNQDLCTYVF